MRTYLPILMLALYAACSAPDDGAVSAAAPAAAEAGWEILHEGGNAADAAVAAAFVLGVAEPAGSGLGGQSVVLLMQPGEEPVVLDGSSFAPHNIPADISDTQVPLTGRRAATVPTTVRTLYALWRDYGSGSMSWPELLDPAISAAEDGVPFGPFAMAALRASADALRGDSLAAATFLPLLEGAPDALVRQPLLAQTLRRIAEDPSSFYEGSLAEEIAADMRTHGGWITREDLAAVRDPVRRIPLHGRFRGRDVYSVPPPYGGWVVLQALELLDGMMGDGDVSASQGESNPARGLKNVDVREDTDAYRDALIRALMAAHRARRDTPVHALRANDSTAAGHLTPERIRTLLSAERAGETTHLSVADADGMVVGISQSVNYFFGAKVMHPGLGFFYNDYMREFVRGDTAHPYALAPGALPYSSMSPTVVVNDGVPVLMLGSPGSARIISAIVEVIGAVIGRDIDLGTAILQPRLHVIPDSSVFFEDAADSAAYAVHPLDGIIARHPPSDILINGRNPWFGGVHAVQRTADGWIGAADPRRDGTVRPKTRRAP